MEEEKAKEKSETGLKTEDVSKRAEHKKDPFSLIGKIAIGLVIITILLASGIYLGMTLNKGSEEKSETSSLTPSPASGDAYRVLCNKY